MTQSPDKLKQGATNAGGASHDEILPPVPRDLVCAPPIHELALAASSVIPATGEGSVQLALGMTSMQGWGGRDEWDSWFRVCLGASHGRGGYLLPFAMELRIMAD